MYLLTETPEKKEKNEDDDEYKQEEKEEDNEEIQPKMYYVGQEELKKDIQGNMTRTLKDRKLEHIANPKEKWTTNCKIKLIGHYIGHNRQDAERVEAMLIQDYKYLDEYKDWKLMNEVYNQKKMNKVEYESNTDQIKLTMDDYIERLFKPIIQSTENGDRQNRIRCLLESEHWKNATPKKQPVQKQQIPAHAQNSRPYLNLFQTDLRGLS